METATQAPPMRIVSFTAANVKALHAIEMSVEDNVIVMGGNNAQGKSSTIDCIAYVLGGEKLCPEDPIRHGETHAEAEITIDDGAKGMIAKRTWDVNRKGETVTQLTLTNRKGLPISKPQTVLAGLIGARCFNPLEFAGLDAKAQVKALRELTGLDFDDLEAEKASSATRRTEVGRELNLLEGQLAGMKETPAEQPVVVADLITERRRMDAVARENQTKRDAARTAEIQAKEAFEDHQSAVEAAAKAAQHARMLESYLTEKEQRLATLNSEIAKLIDPDPSKVDDQIAKAGEINARVDAAKRRTALASKVASVRNNYEELTDAIRSCDDGMRAKIEAAAMPIEGLAFTSDGVTYKGNLFAQLAESERIRVSMSICVAAHPKLRVMLVPQGAYLDLNSLVMVVREAQRFGVTLFIERVGEGDECTHIMEAGLLKSAKGLKETLIGQRLDVKA